MKIDCKIDDDFESRKNKNIKTQKTKNTIISENTENEIASKIFKLARIGYIFSILFDIFISLILCDLTNSSFTYIPIIFIICIFFNSMAYLMLQGFAEIIQILHDIRNKL